MAKISSGKQSTGNEKTAISQTKGISKNVKKRSAKFGSRSLEIAKTGVQTGNDFAKMMSALISDVIEGKITPQISNAAVNAGGKLLKVVEMQLKYGEVSSNPSTRCLQLISE